MATPDMIARLGTLPAGELKILAQGFGQRPKNGAEAAEYLANVPDDQLVPALALLAKPSAPPASPSMPPPPVENQPIPPAPPPVSPPPAPMAKPSAPPPAPAPRTVRLVTRSRIEATYNGHTFVFSPKPGECTACPPAQAAYFKAYFDANEIRYQIV